MNSVLSHLLCSHVVFYKYPTTTTIARKEQRSLNTKPGVVTNPSLTSIRCSACGCSFVDSQEQRAHCKKPWHLHNSEQRRLNPASFVPLSEIEFDNLNDVKAKSSLVVVDAADMTDLTDLMDPNLLSKLSPFVFFRHFSTIVGVYRILFSEPLRSQSIYRMKFNGQEEQIYDCVTSSMQHIQDPAGLLPYWTVILCRGGYFAAAVFDTQGGPKFGCAIAHKTLRRYISRRKQGKIQSLQDKTSGRKTNSAGASLRRQNEQHLVADIHELLGSTWKSFLSRSKFVFYDNPYILQFISPSCCCLKIPFQTSRPTFEESKRVFSRLVSFHPVSEIETDECNYDDDEDEQGSDESLEDEEIDSNESQ